MDVKEIAQNLRDRLKKYDDFQGLYLYGSQIKGSAKPDSDVDIVAIFNNEPSYDKFKSILGEALDLELDYDILIDLHPMTIDELNLNYIFFNEVKKGLYYA